MSKNIATYAFYNLMEIWIELSDIHFLKSYNEVGFGKKIEYFPALMFEIEILKFFKYFAS